MTEEEFLILKEKLTTAARLRGQIAAKKKAVQSWTRTEDRIKKEDKKEWAKNKIVSSINKLRELREEFAKL